jgi:hypothetical protein
MIWRVEMFFGVRADAETSSAGQPRGIREGGQPEGASALPFDCAQGKLAQGDKGRRRYDWLAVFSPTWISNIVY